MTRVRRVPPREGYDLWAETYEATPNPVVEMDSRHTVGLLAPRPGERILDAGCGTGRHLAALILAGSAPVGVDFSRGMLRLARRNHPGLPLVQADLDRELPLRPGAFDAALCALVGEHLTNLPLAFRELCRSLAPGGRLCFSVFHPDMAAAGIEANFERDGAEMRLGAERHATEDYLDALDGAGFEALTPHEFSGDDELARAVPEAARHLGFPVLLAVQARKRLSPAR
jgi:SAM-dependent methyltransferase